jgi:hypothetical protein
MRRIRTQRPNNKRDRRWLEVGPLGPPGPDIVERPQLEASQPASDRHQQQEVVAMGLPDGHTSERTRR